MSIFYSRIPLQDGFYFTLSHHVLLGSFWLSQLRLPLFLTTMTILSTDQVFCRTSLNRGFVWYFFNTGLGLCNLGLVEKTMEIKYHFITAYQKYILLIWLYFVSALITWLRLCPLDFSTAKLLFLYPFSISLETNRYDQPTLRNENDFIRNL